MPNSDNKRMTFVGKLLFLLCLALPFVFFLWVYPKVTVSGQAIEAERIVASFAPSERAFERTPLLPIPEFPQQYANVEIMSGEDGKAQIVAANCLSGRIELFTQTSAGEWKSEVLNPEIQLPAPAHVTPVDLDSDGDRDFVISCIGGIRPTNDKVGRVAWLKNEGDRYVVENLLTDVRRVSDAQCADFDNDGDVDMVVAVFGGLLQGQVLYLENNGEEKFIEYEVMNVSGAIHVPIADYDGDGDLDFAAIISQEEEEVWAFENTGDGFKNAKHHQLFMSWNFDLGTAGMEATDLDGDGDQDLLMALGDNLELINNAAQPWHGVRWLENKGDWNFEEHTIASIGGVYGVSAGDLDGDGDQDVAVVSMFNDWKQENAASVLWLENDGDQNFKTWQIASAPIQLATVDCGDVDGDGKTDIVTGSVHFRPPFINLGSVDVFLNAGGSKSE